MLASIQDLVYACDDQGRLRDLYRGVEFAQGPRAVSPDFPLRPSRIRADGRDVVLLDLEHRPHERRLRPQLGRISPGAAGTAVPDFYAGFVADAVRRAHGR